MKLKTCPVSIYLNVSYCYVTKTMIINYLMLISKIILVVSKLFDMFYCYTSVNNNSNRILNSKYILQHIYSRVFVSLTFISLYWFVQLYSLYRQHKSSDSNIIDIGSILGDLIVGFPTRDRILELPHCF